MKTCKRCEENKEYSKRSNTAQIDAKKLIFRIKKAEFTIDQLRVDLKEISEKRDNEVALHNEAISSYETQLVVSYFQNLYHIIQPNLIFI